MRYLLLPDTPWPTLLWADWPRRAWTLCAPKVLSQVDRLAHIADAGDLDDGTLRGAEDEFTVQARHGTVLGSLLNYESADDRRSGAVLDDTPQGDVLRQGRQAHSQCKDQGCKLFHTLGWFVVRWLFGKWLLYFRGCSNCKYMRFPYTRSTREHESSGNKMGIF